MTVASPEAAQGARLRYITDQRRGRSVRASSGVRLDSGEPGPSPLALRDRIRRSRSRADF